MVAVKYPLGLVYIKLVFGLNRPRQFAHPVEISSDNTVLRRDRRNLTQSLKLPHSFSLDRLGHLCLFDILFNLPQFFSLTVFITQFRLNRLKLFLQEVFPLILVNRISDSALYLVTQFKNFELVSQGY